MDLGSFEKAQQNYAKAIEITPNNPNFYNNLAIAMFNQGNHLQSMGLVLRAIQLNPINPLYYSNYGYFLSKSGNQHVAEVILLKALELDPEHLSALRNLGKVYKELG